MLDAAGPAGQLQFQRLATAEEPTGHGTGIVIGKGTVLTQYLAINIGERHTITTTEGETYPAEIIAADPKSSLAVLRVTSSGTSPGKQFKAPPLGLGKAENASKGRFVVAIGNPLAIASDGQPTASWGIITNTSRRAPLGERLLTEVGENNQPFRTTLSHFGALIQTDAKLGWNSAGGALVNLEGELIGILTTTAAIPGHEAPAGYAIPMNSAMRRIVDTLEEGKEPEYGLLGIQFAPTVGGDRSGVVVSQVYAPGPAGRSGLRQGDRITAINGQAVFDSSSLQLRVGSIAPGEEAVVSYNRAGKPQTTTVRLGKAYIDGPKLATKKRPTWQGLRVDFPTAVPPTTLRDKVQGGYLDPDGCVVVSDVIADSVAWEMGVRPYVYISHVSDQRVSTPDEFFAAINNAEGNPRLTFTKPLPKALQRTR